MPLYCPQPQGLEFPLASVPWRNRKEKTEAGKSIERMRRGEFESWKPFPIVFPDKPQLEISQAPLTSSCSRLCIYQFHQFLRPLLFPLQKQPDFPTLTSPVTSSKYSEHLGPHLLTSTCTHVHISKTAPMGCCLQADPNRRTQEDVWRRKCGGQKIWQGVRSGVEVNRYQYPADKIRGTLIEL